MDESALKIRNQLNQNKIVCSGIKVMHLNCCSQQWWVKCTNQCSYDLECKNDEIMTTITIITDCMSMHCSNLHVQK